MSETLNPTALKLLHKAQQLTQERGYQFLSFQDLADAAGIRKASVHHYFPTKEDLARQMISDYHRRMETWIERIEEKKLTPKQKFNAYFEMLLSLSKNGKCVCPAGALLFEWNNFSKSLKNVSTSFMDVYRSWFVRTLQEGAKLKQLKVSQELISSHALIIGTSLQGALQTARTQSDPEKFLKQIFKHLNEITFKEQNS